MDENKNFTEQDETGEFGRLFRTAFRGFNRQDVVECIARLTRDREREKENAQIQIRELEDAKNQLSLDLAAARKINADLTAQLYQAQALTERAQAETVQAKADAAQHVEDATQALQKECTEKTVRIETLDREASLSRQLLLAAKAQNQILSQQAEVSAHAAAQYAAQLAAAQASAPKQRIPSARTQKLASVLQRVERKEQVRAPLQRQDEPRLRAQEEPVHPAGHLDPAGTETPSAAFPNAVQPGNANVQKRVAAEKKWVNALLSRLLND